MWVQRLTVGVSVSIMITVLFLAEMRYFEQIIVQRTSISVCRLSYQFQIQNTLVSRL